MANLKLCQCWLVGVALFIAVTSSNPLAGQELRGPAFATTERLGRGINMGNMLEAPREGEWGLRLKNEYFEKIASVGFDSVRIPIRWSAHTAAEAPFAIDEAFVRRVDDALAAAANSDLQVVINIHHFNELYADPAGQRDRFLAIWRQLAEHYQDHNESLVFELLNEPHGELSAAAWNALLSDAIVEIRKTNPSRMLIVGPADWNSVHALNTLQLPPDDDRLIVTFHYYLPFKFTHQGASWVDGSGAWIGETWTASPQERSSISSDFETAVRWARERNRPLYLGEFGAYSRADQQSRSRWTSFVRSTAEKHNIAWAYWEFGSGFGAYDPEAEQWRDELLSALIPPSKE